MDLIYLLFIVKLILNLYLIIILLITAHFKIDLTLEQTQLQL